MSISSDDASTFPPSSFVASWACLPLTVYLWVVVGIVASLDLSPSSSARLALCWWSACLVVGIVASSDLFSSSFSYLALCWWSACCCCCCRAAVSSLCCDGGTMAPAVSICRCFYVCGVSMCIAASSVAQCCSASCVASARWRCCSAHLWMFSSSC